MVAVARDYSSPTAKHNILPAAAMHTLVPRWVINVGLSVRWECPLYLRSRPNRCIAATDALGQEETHALQT